MESKADHLADQELVRSVLAGDSRAIDVLVERLSCIPRVLTLLNQRVGSTLGPEDLGDLTQDTLAVLWPRLENYTGEASLETWFYGFCFNSFMNAVRKKRPMQSVDSLLEKPAALPTRLSGLLEYEHVHRSLKQLDERQTRVIRLKYFDELTFEEIGVRLGISPNTVKTHYYRGMRRLEVLLRSSASEVEA